MICLCMALFGFILFGTLCASCTWISVSFFRFGKFSAIISSNTFLIPFSLSSPLEPLLRLSCHALCCLIDLLSCFHFFFICLSVCCSDWVISIILLSRSLIHSFALFSLVFIASRLFILAIELSSFDWFIFIVFAYIICVSINLNSLVFLLSPF